MLMDDGARSRWMTTVILPLERELRLWMSSHAASIDRAERDDLIQEAYVRLWTADAGQIANPRAYFYRIVRNLIVERARRARIVPIELMGEIASLNVRSEEPDPEQSLGARQEVGWLLDVVAALPTQCRRAFELRKFEGLRQREIAQVMGISEKTVEKHLASAFLRISRTMAEGPHAPSPRAAGADVNRDGSSRKYE